MQIRRLMADDLPLYRELRLRAVREEPLAFGASYESESTLSPEEMTSRIVGAPGGGARIVLGAFVDGALVGLVGIGHQFGPRFDHQAFVWGMYVAPEVRGRGIGRALITHAIEAARSLPGVIQLVLTVYLSQPAASHLYSAVGFITYGLAPRAIKSDGQFFDEQYMLMVLSED